MEIFLHPGRFMVSFLLIFSQHKINTIYKYKYIDRYDIYNIFDTFKNNLFYEKIELNSWPYSSLNH